MPPIKIFCVRIFSGAKSNFEPKGPPMGFEMAEKKVYKQSNKHTFSYLYVNLCGQLYSHYYI